MYKYQVTRKYDQADLKKSQGKHSRIKHIIVEIKKCVAKQ